MKITMRLFLLSTLLFTAVIPAHCFTADMQLRSGFTYDYIKGNHGFSVSQLTFPLQFNGTLDKLSYRFMTGFTRTSASAADSDDISMSGLLDTKVGATYQLSGKLPFELLLGLDLNLPTGRTKLTDRQTTLIFDADLLPINMYGEGFNLNPTITAAKGWKNWTFAAGLGYLWRGGYDFSESVKDYKPGMVLNTVAEARYYYLPKSYVRCFTGYTLYGTDTVDGDDYFSEGNLFQIGGAFSHVMNPLLTVTGGLTGIVHGDATVYDGTDRKISQSAYTGDETVLDLGVIYKRDNATLFTIPFQTRLTASNDFTGSKQKISLGLGVTREIIPNLLSADATLRGFYKHDNAAPGTDEDARYTGIGLSASVTGRF